MTTTTEGTMTTTQQTATVISWKTTKDSFGRFVATVYSFGYQVQSVTLGTYTRATRAQAVGAAKQATRYFKARRDVAPEPR